MRKIAIVLALLSIAISGSAQQESGSWSLTPRVGINTSKLSGWKVFTSMDADAKAVKAERKWGLTAGAELEYQAWQQIGLSLGAYYSNEGYRYPFDLTGDNNDKATETMHWLNIPVLVNFYIEPKILKGLALKAGVQLGYLLGARNKVDGTTTTTTSNYKRVNFSIPAGISYTYHGFTADVLYNIGISNLCNVSALDESWRTNSLWITLGYKFAL